MDNIIIAATAFAVVFPAELPDKTFVAALVLGARCRPLPVLAGIWAAFAVHVGVATAVGGLVAALPRRAVELVAGALFFVGAVLLLRSHPADPAELEGHKAAGVEGPAARRVWAEAFGVVLVAEFGDLTQILTATLAARYHRPIPVGVGALLALCTVTGLAVAFGHFLLRVAPLRRVQQFAALVLLGLSISTMVDVLRG
ncbi:MULTISPECIES: TMEM165/GDT1 family protein [unclassified Frankia]